MKHKNIYKILTLQEWHDAQKSKIIKTDLDDKDGFIHFSNANQLAASLELYFCDYEEVVLLLPKMDKIEPFLKYEKAENDSERSGFFAHMYGNLRTDDIEKTWQIKRGAFILPKSILLEAEL
jgi:uncharacterized protein (DUF952 family)